MCFIFILYDWLQHQSKNLSISRLTPDYSLELAFYTNPHISRMKQNIWRSPSKLANQMVAIEIIIPKYLQFITFQTMCCSDHVYDDRKTPNSHCVMHKSAQIFQYWKTMPVIWNSSHCDLNKVFCARKLSKHYLLTAIQVSRERQKQLQI